MIKSSPDKKQEQNSILYEFQIDLELINTLRNFKHESHAFQKNFIETIYSHLSYYQGNQQAEIFDDYSLNKSQISLKEIVLGVHYAFSQIDNLGDLTKALGDSTKILDIDYESQNSTNINSMHTLSDLKSTINHTILNQIHNTIKPAYAKNLKVVINEEIEIEDQEKIKENKDKIFINYKFLSTLVRSKGKLDMYFQTFICKRLNLKLDIQLYSTLFKALVSEKKEDIDTYNNNYSDQFIEICTSCSNLQFNKKIYKEYRNKLIFCRLEQNLTQESYLKMKKEIDNLLLDIQNLVQNFIVSRDQIQQHYLEKLLIGMLGHPNKSVRNYAVLTLNIIYDGLDWQLKGPFTCKISHVHRKFKINYCIESQNDDDIFIQLKSNSFIPECKQNISTIHKPKITEFKVVKGRRFVVVSLDLGRFTRCGFFDWRIVRLGKYNIENVYKITHKKEFISEEVKGRFIIHPRITRDLQLHEVFVDLQNGVQDEKTGKMTQRGNFKTVTSALPEYKKTGVNCLYLMGALERDNQFEKQYENDRQLFKTNRPDASPLAITCRDHPCQMLGGKEGFKELTRKADENEIKIIIDCLTRISSSRMHKKYRKYMLQSLDNQGKQVNVFGTDGRAVHFEDTSLLNYRKKKCWDLFLDEIQSFTDSYGISGIHLDNGQSWPQLFKLNEDEMYRREVDGEYSYSPKEIFEGKIVEEIEDQSGFWGSDYRDTLPNPFLIKICRTLWQNYPNYLIISEVWGKMGGFSEARESTVIQSGPIPRMFKFPQAITQFFGKNLRKDGSMVHLKEPKNVSYFKKWYENTIDHLPEGASLIQSTTYHTFPYPALLYKRGSWAAVDLFFFMPDIPMTFIGEKEGKATKVKTTNFFETYQVEPLKIQEREEDFGQSEAEDISPKSSGSLQSHKSESLLSSSQIIQSKKQATKKMKMADSALFEDDHSDYLSNSSKKRGLGAKSSSFIQLADLEKPNFDELQVVSQEGWGFIDSLKKIKHHYQHRSELRQSKLPLKRGKFIPLTCELQFDSESIHSHVLTFARYTKNEMAVIAINFNDGPIVGKINFLNLNKYFPNYQDSKVVVQMENWLKPELTEENNHYFISEILNMRYEIRLNNFESTLIGFKIFVNNEEKLKQADEDSHARLLQNMASNVPLEIQSNDVAQRLYQLVKGTDSLQDFVDGFEYLYTKYYSTFDLNNFISLMKSFKDDNIAKNKLFAFFQSLLQNQEGGTSIVDEEERQIYKKKIQNTIKFLPVIDKLIKGNNLGPICIATPEYAKYTKTGGLGVMTDELSRGLADLGEEVYVITPWYEDKRVKNPNMLENDGIKYERNMEFWIGGEKYIIGVFYGKVKGVHIYFVANTILFPEAFCGEDSAYIMRQLVLYARVTLQILCDIKKIPSIMVTNDWFSGLIPAYIKKQSYGQVFNNTKVFHIAHNLDETYEGRIYPKPNEGYLEWIHELDYDWLVDRTWQKVIVQPSRCAFITCDNWGTVSHSYKYELLEKSPLRFILETKPNAFSFPNGLNCKERLQFIIDKTGNDHLKAKEQLQKKYFGLSKLNNKIPLYGFVGRITEQKGVHLILDGIHQLIQETNYKIQIILGGMANEKEPYAKDCADKIRKLRHQYPNNFWGDPALFFKDGPLLNSGCDYGLMPSKFEPGGIVQHEFFIASTPVVATKTGGLQDTVWEYNQQTKKGTGFVFSEHTWFHLVQAIKRSIKIFKDPKEYKQLRANAFEGTIDVSDVSRAYAMEYYRMWNKNFLDNDLIEQLKQKMDINFDLEKFQPQNKITKQDGSVLTKPKQLYKNFEKLLQECELSDEKQLHFFYKPKKGTFPRVVQIMGSFSDWETAYDLKYDQFSREWKITLPMKPGDYQYKYKVDEQWMINPNEPQDQDQFLNVNNVIRYDQFLD